MSDSPYGTTIASAGARTRRISSAARKASRTLLTPAGHAMRASATMTSAADIGAYFVLSHGKAATLIPTVTHDRIVDVPRRPVASVNARTTASAAGISGYTANELKRNGAVSATAAQANAAAPTVVARAIASVITPAATAASSTNAATTPR